MKTEIIFIIAAVLGIGSLCGFLGFRAGVRSGNQKTLERSLEIIMALPKPVDRLNARDAASIVAASAKPRWSEPDGYSFDPKYSR